MTQPSILVVEDEAVARRVLHVMLTQSGYAVTSVGSGEEALEELARRRFDLLLTDLQLRKVDGVQVMAAARESDPDIEVIILTGYATLDSAIAAVQHGAYNYILKPGKAGEIEHSVAEALAKRQARVERSAWIRRMGEGLIQIAEGTLGQTSAPAEEVPAEAPALAPPPVTTLRAGDLEIDLHRHNVTVAGRSVQLSNGEFKLLSYLFQHRDQVVSPKQLVWEIMGYDCSSNEARDLIKARIWSLRRKIEVDPTDPHLIVSVRGVGYMLTSGSRS